MNGWIASFLLLLAGRAESQPRQFTLRGTIADAPVTHLYLRYTDPAGKAIFDSARIQQGAFSFTGTVNQPTRAILRANRKMLPDDENRNITPLYLEPGVLTVQLVYNNFQERKVSGSKTQREFDQLTAQRMPVINRIKHLQDSLNTLARQNDQAGFPQQQAHIQDLIGQSVGRLRASSYQFVQRHPDSWVSAYELALFKDTWPIDSVRYLFNRLRPAIQRGADGQRVAEKLKTVDLAKASVGAPAAAFSTTDVTGKRIQLADFKGRYVLLDFWGSWCVPCRAGNPHLLDLYKKYRQKGIEFIGIACEDKPAAWRKAIEKDGIGIWKHILDTELVGETVMGKEKSIAGRYAIDSFPTKLLIDPTGVVIGRYKNEESGLLDEKLKALFD